MTGSAEANIAFSDAQIRSRASARLESGRQAEPPNGGERRKRQSLAAAHHLPEADQALLGLLGAEALEDVVDLRSRR